MINKPFWVVIFIALVGVFLLDVVPFSSFCEERCSFFNWNSEQRLLTQPQRLNVEGYHPHVKRLARKQEELFTSASVQRG